MKSKIIFINILMLNQSLYEHFFCSTQFYTVPTNIFLFDWYDKYRWMCELIFTNIEKTKIKCNYRLSSSRYRLLIRQKYMILSILSASLSGDSIIICIFLFLVVYFSSIYVIFICRILDLHRIKQKNVVTNFWYYHNYIHFETCTTYK